MKKFSNYYKFCMLFAGLSVVCAILAPLPAVCAIFTTITFVFWFAGIMAPDNEKYSVYDEEPIEGDYHDETSEHLEQ